MRSSVETYDLATGESRVIWQTDRLVEAPNWAPTGDWLLINGDGRLFRLPLSGGPAQPIDSGFADACNNDHGIAPDGRRIVLSHHTGDERSVIYMMPVEGGTPRRVTPNAPSYWHGWSPDGATLAYCARRDGRYDIHTIPAEGGEETRLTGRDGAEDGHNDGPDFSHDGRFIWFNSDRSGHAQIWRMCSDGTAVERMTHAETVDWFPHPSPDGKWVLYLSYPPGTLQHPRDRDVALCLMRPDGTEGRELLRFNGGQGTINVPCWAPDSTAFAFVRYFPPDATQAS